MGVSRIYRVKNEEVCIRAGRGMEFNTCSYMIQLTIGKIIPIHTINCKRFSVQFPAISSLARDSRREKSLGIICQKLLMLLLAAPQVSALINWINYIHIFNTIVNIYYLPWNSISMPS